VTSNSNANSSTCAVIKTASVSSPSGWTTWTKVTFDFGSINTTINAGRALRVKLTVDGSSGDAVMFAYDTADYPAALRVE
jgi:hypothetical protein